MMQRRDLIRAFAYASTAGLAAPARAQSGGHVYRIGVLVLTGWETYDAPFRTALADLGYVEGRNLKLEVRSASENVAALDALAAELAGLKVDLIVTLATPPTLAAKRATAAIPIAIPIVMMAVADPVGSGLAASLARPGGNVTGLSSAAVELVGKNLELLREMKPGMKTAGVLINAPDAFAKVFLEQLTRAAATLGIGLLPVLARGAEDLEAAFAGWARVRAGGVVLQATLANRQAAELALRHRLPSAAARNAYAGFGGLMCYSANLRDMARQTAVIASKILKGAKPADLPVELPTRYELTVNRNTARVLRITIPRSVLLRADQVIE